MKEIVFVLDYETFKDNLLETAEYVSKYVDKIWFRVKNVEAKEVYVLASLLRNSLPDTFLILSGRPDIAFLTGFDGVHLNASNSALIRLKNKFPNLLFGFSAHSIKEILDYHFDYFTLSPIFYTKKRYPVNPIGSLNVSEIKKDIYALGGIDSGNIFQLKNKGYKGVAGISLLKEISEIKKIMSSFSVCY